MEVKQRDLLYRLMISQLFYDGHQQLAVNLASAVKAHHACPPSEDRLLNVLKLGLKSEEVPRTGGMQLNGVNTQGENIADNGGIKESFKAYRDWVRTARSGVEEDKLPGMDYTPNQLYFLNAAQIWCDQFRDKAKIKAIFTSRHSISQYRVYGPMQNFDEFAKAWNCPVGSYMNPSNKCAVW